MALTAEIEALTLFVEDLSAGRSLSAGSAMTSALISDQDAFSAVWSEQREQFSSL